MRGTKNQSCRPVSKEKFADLLLEWWKLNKRDFPWRRTNNPYVILVSEMLLRKTTAKQVNAIFEKFFTKFPNVKMLAEADEEEIEELIKPLGMEHKRAVLLKKLANELLKNHGGAIPASQDDLLKLPGVGRYSANAVLCFAYGKDAPLVDVNAIRVFQRVFSVKSQKRRIKDDTTFWEFVAETIPKGKAREFNLAIIDFAHEVCRPKKPKCAICPLCVICIFASEEEKIEDQ
ncbi:MAG: hypothetical protein QXT44_07275 [Candidatus Bathyarchaeia archaeon]